MKLQMVIGILHLIVGIFSLVHVHHVNSTVTVFPWCSAPGRLPIFDVFGGALNRAGALIKTYENLDLPFPAHTRTFFSNI